MLKLIVEGPDASGKSTLVERICQEHNFKSVRGEGPEKYPGEINQRALRWFEMHQDTSFQIFDRHPCISHPIYGPYSKMPPMNETIRTHLYAKPLFIVYCMGKGMDNHQESDGIDSDEHVTRVKMNYTSICRDYDKWACQYAHFIYDYTDKSRVGLLSAMIGANREKFI